MSKIPSLIDDCFLHDKDRLLHDEAIGLLQTRLSTIVSQEEVPCSRALGRVIAETVLAPHNVPMHRNSAVDGYAFFAVNRSDTPLPVSSRVAAGDLAPAALKAGTAVRIFTGAPMPDGADTIAMQEDCVPTGDTVQLPTGLKAGANCRLAGEDLNAGDEVLRAGTQLKAADLAALASIGRSSATVYQKLKVALFSNGNEMRVPDDTTVPLQPGEVYDANQPLISALCATLPVELTSCGIIPDNHHSALEAIDAASEQYDIIITTGGASKGAEDHMLSVLDQLGKRHLWQLAVKPGRPMMFGQIEKKNSHCLFFGLPGNPVAAMICFLLYAGPALKKLAGADWQNPPRFKVPAGFSIAAKKPNRREFLRGKLLVDGDGNMSVQKYARDGSGLISSLRESDGLIEIPEDVTAVCKGDMVSYIPFSVF